MNSIYYFFRLIRPVNLLIIIVTQYLMRWFIIKPMLLINEFALQMVEFDFFLLSLSTVLIAAAGYVINDYFDLKIDQVNKPKKLIVGRHIKRRVAMGAHLVLNILGLAIGAWVGYKYGMIELAAIHLFSAGSLWFYSTNFKNQFLLGNVIIAILAALVPLIVGLFEIPLLNKYYSGMVSQYGPIFNPIAFWIMGYSLFAFLLTLAREITKDIVDIKGDKNYGCKTIPITLGVKKTKYFILAVYAVIMVLLFYAAFGIVHEMSYLPLYIQLLIVLILFNCYKVVIGKTKTHFAFSSNLNKVITLIGVLSALLVSYNVLEVLPN